ncbi:MAG TPA: hypothetical protein VEV62_11805 [Parafilimonas sp.]|nr:hypothetical protein [Parafilimonas sp.]
MKKNFTLGILTLGVFILIFISCKKEINTALNSSSKLSAKAEVSTSNEKIPADLLIFIPCANGGAGEYVELSGFLHATTHVTVTGNNFHVKYHTQPQGISGVGQTTGDKYQATGVTQEQYGGSFVNGQYEDTYVNNFKIIGQGTGNNYLIHESLHVTINANGTVTTLIDNFTADCK